MVSSVTMFPLVHLPGIDSVGDYLVFGCGDLWVGASCSCSVRPPCGNKFGLKDAASGYFRVFCCFLCWPDAAIPSMAAWVLRLKILVLLNIDIITLLGLCSVSIATLAPETSWELLQWI